MKNENDIPAVDGSFPRWMLDEVAAYDLELVQAPRVILDIGANIGAFSARMVAKYPEARIHAYEPVSGNYNQLLTNMPLDRVTCWQFAIRDHSGIEKIFLGDRGVTCSFHQLGRQTDTVQNVSCLDAACLPEADFVKIDTEGCEVEILSRLNLEPVIALVVEYHRAEDRLTILTVGESAGFELVQEIPGDATGQWGCLKFARPGSYHGPRTVPVRSAPNEAPSSASPKRLFIGLCLCGNTPPASVHAFARLAADPPIHAKIAFDAGGGSVYMARNEHTARFLKSDCTHLAFCDDDLIPSPADFQRIASHNVPVVGGMYPIKCEGPLKWCGNGFPDQPEAPIGADGLQRVRYIGTGFMCVERSVVERVIAFQRDEIEYTLDHPPYETRWHLWREAVRKTDDQRKRLLTEDWLFCQICLELGIPVYADTKIRLGHTGTATWPLQSQLTTDH
jgi:FkbM family methyltransferase